jgi:hypothetical protein
MKSVEVNDSLVVIDPDRKAALGTIRSLIFESIPGVIETMK